jgi:hypothetical protein
MSLNHREMSDVPGSPEPKKGVPKGHVALIGSLALVAIVLSPLTPMPQSENRGTDELLVDCQSLRADAERMIAGNRTRTVDNEVAQEQAGTLLEMSQREMHASAILMNEFCNRPALVLTIINTHEPVLNLLAYACEAAAGTSGYEALPSSVKDYQDIYCTTAFQVIESRIAVRSDSVEEFFYKEILSARDQFAEDSVKITLVSEAESILVNASGSLQHAQELLDSGLVYESAGSLEAGISLFTSLKERQEMQFLLE